VTVDKDELLDIKRISKWRFRSDPEVVILKPPPDNSLTTDDVDPLTGQRYPDYLERRRAREIAVREAVGEKQVLLLGNVSPKK
jgi:hypothetical protein